jgi:hypothetical protein
MRTKKILTVGILCFFKFIHGAAHSEAPKETSDNSENFVQTVTFLQASCMADQKYESKVISVRKSSQGDLPRRVSLLLVSAADEERARFMQLKDPTAKFPIDLPPSLKDFSKILNSPNQAPFFAALFTFYKSSEIPFFTIEIANENKTCQVGEWEGVDPHRYRAYAYKHNELFKINPKTLECSVFFRQPRIRKLIKVSRSDNRISKLIEEDRTSFIEERAEDELIIDVNCKEVSKHLSEPPLCSNYSIIQTYCSPKKIDPK